MNLRQLTIFPLCLVFSSILNAKEFTLSAIENSAYLPFASGVVSEAYQRLHYSISIAEYPAARSLLVSNKGERADGELFRISGAEIKFTNLIPVEVPLSFSDWVVISRDKDIVIEGWQSLKPYLIASRGGVVTTDLGTQGMNVTKVDTNEQLVLMLVAGRVDVIVMSRNNALKYVTGVEHEELLILEPPVQRIPVYHFINKKNINILNELTEVMSTMSQEGFIEEAFEKHLEWLSNQ